MNWILFIDRIAWALLLWAAFECLCLWLVVRDRDGRTTRLIVEFFGEYWGLRALGWILVRFASIPILWFTARFFS